MEHKIPKPVQEDAIFKALGQEEETCRLMGLAGETCKPQKKLVLEEETCSPLKDLEEETCSPQKDPEEEIYKLLMVPVEETWTLTLAQVLNVEETLGENVLELAAEESWKKMKETGET